MTKNPGPYRVDGEVGRIEFPTYRVDRQETTLYDTAREVFPPLGCWERYETRGVKELALMYGVTEQSYPKTAKWLNRIRHQEGATGATTLWASVVREGKPLEAAFERTTTAILQHTGCDETGQPLTSTPLGRQEGIVIPIEQVKAVIDACDFAVDERAEVEQHPIRYEQPTETVNISLDDVVVKQQKRHRTHQEDEDDTLPEEGRRDVHQTVAHLQQQDRTYCMTGQGVLTV